MKKYYEDVKLEILTLATDVITTSDSSPWVDAEEDGDVTKIPDWW